MLSINTNLSSLIVQGNLKQSTNSLNTAIERMTTGYKINHASDNAANYSIKTNMDTKIGAYQVAEDNAMQAIDLVETASGNLAMIEDRLSRLRMLQEQALNGTYGEESRYAINMECNSLVDEINRLYLTTEYNGINLFLEKTTNTDGDAEILQEVYADSATTFEELGITSSSFSVYDKNDNVLATYDIEGEDTLDNFFATLETHNFDPIIVSGKISVKSTDNSYIAGALADELGITTELESYVASTSQTSSTPVTYQSITSSTSEETFYTTTTSSTTQTQTIWVTTTSEQTSTETITVTTTTETTHTETITGETTVGIAKSSSSKITYNKIENEYAVNPDASCIIFGAITAISRGTTTISVTPTDVATVQELLDFTRQYYTDAELMADSTGGYGHITSGGIVLFFQTDRYPDPDGIIVTSSYGGITVSSTTTSTITASTTTKLSTIGVSSTQYITVLNNGTQTIITCKSSDTIGSVTAKLTSAGLAASFSNGKISISASETSYISGISSTLASELNLSGSYSSVKTTSTEVTTTSYTTTTEEVTNTTTVYVTTTSEQTTTQTLLTTTTSSETRTTTTYITTTETATLDTSFADLGVKSGINIGIIIDGQSSSLTLDKNLTIDDLVTVLESKGLTVSFSANKLTIEGDGNSYVSSSSLTNLFKLGTLNKITAERNANTTSDKQIYTKNLLDELGDIYAPGEVSLQVGITEKESSALILRTAFSLVGYGDLRNIGIDDNNYLEKIDEMLSRVSEKQTELGAVQNRLMSVLEEINVQYENLVSSRSTIQDADMSEVSATYIQQQILQQASATLMATANQTPAIALQLI